MVRGLRFGVGSESFVRVDLTFSSCAVEHPSRVCVRRGFDLKKRDTHPALSLLLHTNFDAGDIIASVGLLFLRRRGWEGAAGSARVVRDARLDSARRIR